MTEARADAPEQPDPRSEDSPAPLRSDGLTGQAPARPALVDALGGRRGLLDSALPVLVFVFTNSVATALTDNDTGLRAALAAALVAGLGLVGLRLARRETLQQAFSGFFALAIAAWFAHRTGEARDFHLPHILWQIGYGSVFLVSVLLRRPLVGFVYQAVDGLDPSWRRDRRLRRVFAIATLGWFAVFAVRAAVLGSLYLADRSGWLAVARLLMGWPLTISAAVATIAWVKRGRAAVPAG